MIDRCRRFVRSQERLEPQRIKRGADRLFGKRTLEVFGQLLARLGKSDLEKPLEGGIVEGAFFANGQHGRSDLGGRDKRFGRNLETQPGLSCTRRQYRKRGEIPLARTSGKFECHFFLYHDQNGLAQGVVQCLEDKMGRNVIGEVGHQMIGGIQQALLIPMLNRIATRQRELSRGNLGGKLTAQMLA